MHTYWRINEELKYLGEVLVFHDPSLKRCYEEWICKKAEALSMLDMDSEKKPSTFFRVTRDFHCTD
jgi:hypothetical protein